jgi:hypothetical protein
MLNEYQNDMWTQPAKVFFPGLAIFICVLAFNTLETACATPWTPFEALARRSGHPALFAITLENGWYGDPGHRPADLFDYGHEYG